MLAANGSQVPFFSENCSQPNGVLLAWDITPHFLLGAAMANDWVTEVYKGQLLCLNVAPLGDIISVLQSCLWMGPVWRQFQLRPSPQLLPLRPLLLWLPFSWGHSPQQTMFTSISISCPFPGFLPKTKPLFLPVLATWNVNDSLSLHWLYKET